MAGRDRRVTLPWQGNTSGDERSREGAVWGRFHLPGATPFFFRQTAENDSDIKLDDFALLVKWMACKLVHNARG